MDTATKGALIIATQKHDNGKDVTIEELMVSYGFSYSDAEAAYRMYEARGEFLLSVSPPSLTQMLELEKINTSLKRSALKGELSAIFMPKTSLRR